MKKGSKRSKKITKKEPFAKHEPSGAMGLVIALTVFNLVYSSMVGLPVPQVLVASYVDAVHELGDAQERAYNTMGAVVVATISAVGDTFAPEEQTQVAAPTELVSAIPEPLLRIAPNQLSVR